ncbi:hypothetical protein SAMN06264364_11763 [Quadrisphaera granulorum]|uniref:Transcriptional regulator, AbiEi antitoxin, Type IV TA system n=1 Tax=Quadrisphaera granulorum TaxID=317664 RepID=A0A316A4J1_9ACTN|nr:hypothetical protein [Quadrisphaera granulorum]PWJ52811.1 hypothetical protein BXY45_11763 [Quadrisphaera granulorum]SZE97416.1 hypothetical protein SAMN06264364_11763 [Quadrisphaera granulorum]
MAFVHSYQDDDDAPAAAATSLRRMELLLDPSLPQHLAGLALSQRGVLTTGQLLAAGLNRTRIHDIGRRDGWRTPLQGTRMVAVQTGPDASQDLMRAWNQAAALVLPHAALGFDSAAVEWGLVGVPRCDGVTVIVPPGKELRARPGLRVLVRPLTTHDVVSPWGLRTTSMVRTLADLLPTLDRPSGLAVLDGALRRRVRRSDLATARERARGSNGWRQVDDLWELANPDAETPLESRVRSRMIDGHLAPNALQQRLRDSSGRVYARPDMTIDRHRRRRPERGPLYIEADGRGPHGSPGAAYRDRDKASDLLADGADIERFTWDDTFDPMRIPWRLRRAL